MMTRKMALLERLVVALEGVDANGKALVGSQSAYLDLCERNRADWLKQATDQTFHNVMLQVSGELREVARQSHMNSVTLARVVKQTKFLPAKTKTVKRRKGA